MKKLNKITWDDILGKICYCFYKNNFIVLHNGYITIYDNNKNYLSSFIMSYNANSLSEIKDRIKILCNNAIAL